MLSLMVVADASLIAGNVTGVGATVLVGNLQQTSGFALALQSVLKVLLCNVLLHHDAQQFLCLVFVGLGVAVEVGEESTYCDDNHSEGGDDGFLVLDNHGLGGSQGIVDVKGLLVFLLAHCILISCLSWIYSVA